MEEYKERPKLQVPAEDVDKLRSYVEAAAQGDFSKSHDIVPDDGPFGRLAKEINHLVNEFEARSSEYHASSMELAMGLSDAFAVLSTAISGDLSARVTDSTLSSSDGLVSSLGRTINDTMASLESQYGEVERYHESSMELALGLSECFAMLSSVKEGDLYVQVSDEVLNSSNSLIASLGRSLNETVTELREQLEIVQKQRMTIQELSTPILKLWDDVLALPIIGVVDTRRTTEIMETLLAEIMRQQSRYVIIDVTGVDVVDTRTADYFIRITKASELLGAKCVLTGIRPAVAQTLVEIGVDLSGIMTLRTLRDGLRACITLMEKGA